MNSYEKLFDTNHDEFALLVDTTMFRQQLIRCTHVIKRCCDGARKKDGCGFNKLDATAARDFLRGMQKSPEPLRKWAIRLLKYRGQLASLGFTYPQCLWIEHRLNLAPRQNCGVPKYLWDWMVENNI